MFKKIAYFLNQQNDVAEWQITRDKEFSTQLYVTDYQTESDRTVEQESYSVSVLTKRDDPNFLGESSVLLQPGDSVEEKLTDCLKRAGYVKNKAYTLPEAPSHVEETLFPERCHDTKETVQQIAQDYEEIKNIEGVKLSYYEIFVTDHETSIENSKGLKTKESLRDIFTEFVLLSDDGKHEAYNSKQAGNYEKLNIGREIFLSADAVRNAETAKLPQNGRVNVLFTEEALDTLFNYFVDQATASSLYAGWSVFKENEEIISKPKGDLLTLESDPTIDGLVASSQYDRNGLKREKLCLIKKNIFKNRTAIQKYACYTGVKATGVAGNIIVATGSMSLEELYQEGTVLEVQQFSTFEPNEVTGAFSGEIRFGKLRDKEEISWIKGGSVSGSIAEAFQNVRFSQESTERSAYRGPAGVLIYDLSVAGKE